MNTEVLLMGVFIGLTLLAYMVAINAHGPVRLALSYLIATAMLAGTVWAIVQHVNTQINTAEVERFKRLEIEKQQVEQKVVTQERALMENRERLAAAAKLTTAINKGTALATTMANTGLQESAGDLDQLKARAADMARRVADYKSECTAITISDTSLGRSLSFIKEAAQLLSEAAYFYRSYYVSEDSDQEQLRERLMRQKARDAVDRLQKAGTQISSGG